MSNLRILFITAAVASFGGNAVAASNAGGLLDCLVEPHVVIEVSSPVPGVIGSIAVEKSDMVQRGQPLAKLESAVWESTVREARSRASASAAVESARVNVAFAERNFTRIEELFNKGVVATHHLDEAHTEVQLANADLRRAQENRQLARLELQRAEESLRQRTIRSPIDGVVVSRQKSPGEFVEVSPILALAQLNPLKIQVIAPAEMFGTIKEGMQGEVRVESSDKPYLATVSLVDRIVDGASGSFGVQLELPNPDYEVPVGLRCQVSITAAPPAAPATVPALDTGASEVSARATISENPPVPKAERSAKSKPPVRVAAAAPAQDEQDECFSIGPVTDAGLAGRLERELTDLDVPFSRRQASAVSGYLVLTPPQASRKEAEQLLNGIRNGGVQDVALLTKPPYANRVSLGYYSQLEEAEERHNELAALRIEAAVVERRTRGAGLWLDVPAGEAAVRSDAMVNLLSAANVQSRSTTRSCGAGGQADTLHASRGDAGGN